ncbi:MAG: phosphatidylserine decarboxylase [Pseudomonadota bacterium]
MKKEDNILYTIIKTIPPINSEGWKFIAIFASITALLALFSCSLFWVGVILTLWCAYFFRDPIRVIPNRGGLIVSPADGIVQNIVKIVPPPQLKIGDAERVRISIFLNVFDVHVNRIPLAGTVSSLFYFPGQFFNASLDKASEENERQYISVTTDDGYKVGFVQIAGLIARRIVCHLKEGQEVQTGDRFGLIRFGSRVDIYLPENLEPLVVVGQRAIGGETIIADFKSSDSARTGINI